MTKVAVTQDSPGTEPVGDSHTHRDEKMRYRNCSQDGGGREIRQSAVGRREEQGSWSDAVPTPGAPTSKGRRRRMSRSKQRTNAFALSLPFCSIQTLGGWNDARLYWGGPSLLELPIQALIPETRTCPDSALPATRASRSPVKLT